MTLSMSMEPEAPVLVATSDHTSGPVEVSFSKLHEYDFVPTPPVPVAE